MKTRKIRLDGYQFLLPFLFFYILFTFYPLIQGLYVSFTEWNIVGDKTFIGLSNYFEIFTDKIFWTSLWNSTYFTILSTPLLMLSGFVLALILDSKRLRLQTLFRGIYFAPHVLSVSVISSVWGFVLAKYSGLLNGVLGTEIAWTNDVRVVWWAIIGLTIWWTQGFNMILYLAGLQDIPPSHYEAADLEGASWFQKIFHITIPSLKHIHFLVLFLQLIASFKVFGQVFLITQGGPGGATRTIIQYLYETGFQRYYVGEASAVAFALFIVLFIISMLQRRLLTG